MIVSDIHEKVAAYHGKIEGITNYRYRSWEHCYAFFQKAGQAGLAAHREHAALQLGFYLASWGMYRGSCFLLQYDYTAHLPVVDHLTLNCQQLWDTDFGSSDDHFDLIPDILALKDAIWDAYGPCGQPTDTLLTKVILGTVGCLPATDRFFRRGWQARKLKYSWPNRKFAERVLKFSLDHLVELRSEQARIKSITGAHYPLMKLVDMYFWQIGYEIEGPTEEVVV